MKNIHQYGNTSDLQCHFTTRRFHCTARIVIISLASYLHTNHLLGRHIAHIYIECDSEDVVYIYVVGSAWVMYVLSIYYIYICNRWDYTRLLKFNSAIFEANLFKVLIRQTCNKLCISKLCFVYGSLMIPINNPPRRIVRSVLSPTGAWPYSFTRKIRLLISLSAAFVYAKYTRISIYVLAIIFWLLAEFLFVRTTWAVEYGCI